MSTEPQCADCGTTKRERSACPLCGKVLCQPCAEKPYESCCDGETAGKLLDLMAALRDSGAPKKKPARKLRKTRKSASGRG